MIEPPTDAENARQQQLDELERTNPWCATMGRALIEWSGIDPTDTNAIEAIFDAVGSSSIPGACREIADSIRQPQLDLDA